MSVHWIVCPKCKAVTGVVRVGSVGVKGAKDSNRFKCEACGTTFRVKGGETWQEGLRSKGL